MTDGSGQPNLAERAADSLTDARRAVEDATEDVADAGRRFKAAVDGQTSRGLLRVIEDWTRAAPLPMLGAAFVAGVWIATRRG